MARPGSIFKAADGRRWVARLQYTDRDGRRREKRRLCPSWSAANLIIKQLCSKIEALKTSSKENTYRMLDDFYRREYVHPARFASGRKLSGFRQDVRSVNRYLDRALEFFEDRPLKSITYADCRNYKNRIASLPTRRGQTRSMSDINHHLKRLRRLFTVAVEQEWLAANPFTRGGPLIVESFETERTRILSPDEETRLLAACSRWRARLRPIVIIAIETALRRGELQSLRWLDVNLPGRYLKIEGTNSKTLRSRMVPLSNRAVVELERLWSLSAGKISGFVFGSGDFRKAFNGACSQAGLADVNFHDLRHTAITRWLESGISPAIAMKASGHSQMRTFLRYVNQNEASILEFATKISRA